MNTIHVEKQKQVEIPVVEGYWVVPDSLDVSGFNFEWRPDPYDPPYIHQFGTQWQKTGGPRFIVKDASEVKYHDSQHAIKLPEPNKFKRLVNYEIDFDYSWHPDETEPDFLWTFGSQFLSPEEMPVLEYSVNASQARKFVHDLKAKLMPNKDCWVKHHNIDDTTFDWSWVPHPWEPPFIYVWGNYLYDGETMPTIEYRVPGATQIKYMHDQAPKLVKDMTNWTVPQSYDSTDFDFGWKPNPYSPPQIYQWENNGPTYTVPGAKDIVLMKSNTNQNSDIKKYLIQTTLDDLISQHPDETFWALNPDIDYTNFNFAWCPDETNFMHLNAFGTVQNKDTKTYYVNATAYTAGHKQVNYVETEIEIVTTLDMFYVDMGNDTQYEKLKQTYPHMQKTRFMNGWIETINRCAKKSHSKLFWVLCSHLDYSEFKFDFYPSTWQMDMIHVFGTQWNHWGNTYLVNKSTFEQQIQNITVLEHLSNINHVRTQRAPNTVCRFNFVYIDHGNPESNACLDLIKNQGKPVDVVKFDASYLQTFKNYILSETSNRLEQKWVVSSLCNYEKFDFTWLPDPFQTEQIHVFASELDKVKQKYGDTFVINFAALGKDIQSLNKLENYASEVNYISHIAAKRYPHPVKLHKYDSQVQAISLIDDSYPYTELVNINDCYSNAKRIVASVWDPSHQKILIGSSGSSQILVPRVIKTVIKNELYDYPLIDSTVEVADSKPLDIIFISNGEPVAEDNYEHLLAAVKKSNAKNTVKRVQNVNGRVASQHAAANLSSTSWYFLVNGKIRVSDIFDWGWQPDRLQAPKHYIFTVTNPVNGLVYGHQAIVANNKRLTLNTEVRGLDFTLDSLHEVVDINCGIAMYNSDAWTEWRTAFREVIKLKNNTDQISADRLNTWLTVGQEGNWSVKGANDGVAYYDSVQGNMTELMKSYDWDWIRTYFTAKYEQQ